jgi:hypothetical protein
MFFSTSTVGKFSDCDPYLTSNLIITSFSGILLAAFVVTLSSAHDVPKDRLVVVAESGKHLHEDPLRLPTEFTPDELERLKTTAKKSGLKEQELDSLAKVLQKSKLNKDQMTKLEEAFIQHGPTPVDLKTVMEQLNKVRKARESDEEEQYLNNLKYGSDWLFKPVIAQKETDKATSSS